MTSTPRDPLNDPLDGSAHDTGHELSEERPHEPQATTTRHEERLETGTELHESGRLYVRKHVETTPVEQVVERRVEHADTGERVAALEGDSGEVETLEDGSLSIPVFEEVLVVTKKLVVRERVIVRKHTVIDEHTLETELRREHVTVDADDGLEVEVRDPGHATTPGSDDGRV